MNSAPLLENFEEMPLDERLFTAIDKINLSRPDENDTIESYEQRQIEIAAEALGASWSKISDDSELAYSLTDGENMDQVIVVQNPDNPDTQILRIPIMSNGIVGKFIFFEIPFNNLSTTEKRILNSMASAILGNFIVYEDMVNINQKKTDEFLDLVNGVTTRMAHHIKTPLAILSTSSYLAKRGLDNYMGNGNVALLNKVNEQLAKMESNVGAVDKVLEAATSYLGHVSGNIVNIPKEEDVLTLNTSINDLLSSKFKNELENGDIEFVVDSNISEQAKIKIDSSNVMLSIKYIIDNALNFHPENRTNHVKVSVTEDSNNIVISVEDNGIGISPENLERIYEPFFQVSEAGTLLKYGTGFGTGIKSAKILLETNRAELNIDSQLGQGTVVRVLIPKK